MRVLNPANGETLRELDDDTPDTIADKLRRAKATQREWARAGYERRQAALQRFAEIVAERKNHLAATLTSEVGKPIKQAKNELDGLLVRVQFFIENAAREVEDEVLATVDRGGVE